MASLNIDQVYTLNPITSNAATDLMYFGKSPYGPGNDAAMTYANFAAQFAANVLSAKGDLYTFSTLNARLAVGTTNGQILQVLSSASTGLAWSTATYPVTTTINQLLFSSSNNVVGQITAGNNGVLITSATGVPSILANGTTGQVLTATTGAPASWENVPAITQFIVNPVAGLGNYTTIQAAITAASAGTDVYITPGTYTENLTLKAGVNLTSLRGNASSGLVVIVGNATFNGAGIVNIANVTLQTNSAPFLTVSGSAASVLNLIACYLNCTNNTGISYTSSNAASAVNIARCLGDIGTTGIAIYSMSSTGTLTCRYCSFTNSGGSVLQSTNSSGTVNINYCLFLSPISSSGTGVFLKDYSFVDTSAQNVTSLEMGGSGTSTIRFCDNKAGTAPAISIDSGSKVNIFAGTVNSSNTNAITGGGVLSYGMLGFAGSSNTINVSTQLPIALTTFQGGTGLTAYVLGDTLYSSAANVLSRLSGNTTTAKQYLSQTGTGAVSAAPSWATISGADITGAALTKVDDTNVTLTLGGTPATSLLRATSLTLGWTGQLGLTRGGTAASLTASNGGIVYSSASALAILSGTATAGLALLSGANTTPSWSSSPPITQINVQRITASGAGTYTPTTGMKYVIVQAQAAGGGGGGAATAVATQFAIGGGGGGGEYIEILFTSAQIGASKPYVVGAKGTGGVAGNNGGSPGGDTTFNASWIIASGGTGGNGGASAAASQFFVQPSSPVSGSFSTGMLIAQISGWPNGVGFALVTQGQSSSGGTSGYGLVGPLAQIITSTTTGVNASSNSGAGGGGGGTYNGGTNQAGGDGGDGFINFIEFISI